MSNSKDSRDWVIMALVTAGWAAATVFLFLYPAPMNFATWSGVTATLVGVYHWLTVSDDKRVDAGNVAAAIPNMIAGAADAKDWLHRETYAGDRDARVP